MIRPIRVAAVLFFAVSISFAQRSSAPASGSSGNSGSTGGGKSGSTSPTPTPQPSTNPSTQPQQQPVPIFLYGRVMLDDGTPPPSSTQIKQICGGSQHTVGFTSGNGQFNVQFGSRSGNSIFDASDSGWNRDDPFGNIGALTGQSPNQMSGSASLAMSMAGCDLVADLAGFRSDRINMATRLANDNPDVGIIVLHRLVGVEGTSISMSTLNAPKDAKKAWEKGRQNLQATMLGKDRAADADKKLANAEKDLLNAVTIYPKFAVAWSDLGKTRMLRQNPEGAKDAFLKAMAADGKLVDPYVAVGELALRDKDWDGAAQYLGKALQLDSVDYPLVWFEDAIVNFNLQHYDKAEKDARESLKLPAAQSNPHANELLGLILMNKHDYAGAREALTAYLATPAGTKDPARAQQALNDANRLLADNVR